MVNCLLHLHWLLPPSFGLTIITLALLIQSVFVPVTVMAIQYKKLAAWMTQGTVAFQKSSGKGASETRSYTWAPRLLG